MSHNSRLIASFDYKLTNWGNFMTVLWRLTSVMIFATAIAAAHDLNSESERSLEREKAFLGDGRSRDAASNSTQSKYFSVEGWPGWSCMDYDAAPDTGQKRHWLWRLKTQALYPNGDYMGSCGAWERTGERLPYIKSVRWSPWACADFVGSSASRWYVLSEGIGTALDWDGSCASWEK